MVSFLELIGEHKMHSITIKNIPADLYDKLKIKARENRRSINNEVINCIDRSLRSRRIDAEEFIAKIEFIHHKHKVPKITAKDLKEGIREGRL